MRKIHGATIAILFWFKNQPKVYVCSRQRVFILCVETWLRIVEISRGLSKIETYYNLRFSLYHALYFELNLSLIWFYQILLYIHFQCFTFDTKQSTEWGMSSFQFVKSISSSMRCSCEHFAYESWCILRKVSFMKQRHVRFKTYFLILRIQEWIKHWIQQ